MNVSRYFHTIRHLRSIQILARIWYRIYYPREPYITHHDLGVRQQAGTWQVICSRSQSFFPPHDFEFLGVRLSASGKEAWSTCSPEKLWIYNLHYFDDLMSENASERAVDHGLLVARWIHENPYGKGCGWEPYTISLRSINWIKWAWSGHVLPNEAILSLARQLYCLAKKPEYHILANHLFVNAKALIFGGVFFTGSRSECWLQQGLKILRAEINEQILPDGGNYELSPMYHSIILEDILDLLQLTQLFPGCGFTAEDQKLLQATARRMLNWLAVMRHPDAKLALFNDCAQGIAPTYEDLSAYARALGVIVDVAPERLAPVTLLPDTGYVRVESGEAVAILDVGEVGPTYQPGHAHADTLSFELSLFGQRVLVNSGTSRYGQDEERHRQRSTPAHNTVDIGGLNSSEVWGGFRVARRAKPEQLVISDRPSGLTISCSHNGYYWLRNSPRHTRQWVFGAGSLHISDIVTGAESKATAHFHIHPQATVEQVGKNCVLINLGWGGVEFRVNSGKLRLVPATFHEYFGSSVPSQKITVELESGKGDVVICWQSQDKSEKISNQRVVESHV